IGIYQYLSREQAVFAAAFLCAIFIPLDFFRIRSEKINHLFLKFAGRYMRSNEKDGLTGTSYLFVGLLILISIFPKSIATLALAMLAVGDPLASIFGVLYGKDKLIGNKSFQGTLAAFIACTLIAFLYFFYMNLMTERLLLVSILAGLVGATSELIPLGDLDDNLSFPVFASILLLALFHLFGGFV
ncbi:MAG: hypothetical protein KDD37_09405, partial [Bdellovibrionales bacterium]|nr:hypothetical protein [Bdellovibrionales bacterium]